MQHFRVDLDCGHSTEVTAVEEFEGKPYKPNYVGMKLKCRECFELATATAQKQIGRLTGQTGQST